MLKTFSSLGVEKGNTSWLIQHLVWYLPMAVKMLLNCSGSGSHTSELTCPEAFYSPRLLPCSYFYSCFD